MTDRRARFEEIYDAYSGLILTSAARRTPNIDEAADIVAETFVVAWRRLDDIPDGEQARPWLYGVARRVLANHHRGSRRRRRLDERLATVAPDPAATRAPDTDGPGRAEIAVAFRALSDPDCELLTLPAWDGLDRAQIATIPRCRPATIPVRPHPARTRLRR